MAKEKKTPKRRGETRIRQDRYAGWLGVMECLELCPPSEVVSLMCARCHEPLPGMPVSKFLDRNRRADVHECRACGANRFTLKYLTMIENGHLFALNSQHLRTIYHFLLDESHDVNDIPDRYRRLTGQLPIWFFAPSIRQKTLNAVMRMMPEL